MTTTHCAANGKPHLAEPGSQLCRNHTDELGEWLHDVEREYSQLEAAPSLQGNWDGARSGSLASHQTPARLGALVHLDPRHVQASELTGPAGVDGTLSALGTLSSWVDFIRSERDLTPPGRWTVERIPGRPGPFHDDCEHTSCRWLRYRNFRRDRRTVAGERQFLSRHLEWAASQPWAGDLWNQVRVLRRQLQSVNGTGEPRISGSCPECGGHLHSVKPEHTSGTLVHVGASLLQAVECERDPGHRWESHHLLRLALILEEQQAEQKR